MTNYTESGLQVSLPDGNNFRFQDLTVYTKLKGKHLKEVDYCWWDTSKNKFWLLEVKDYSHLTIEERLPDNLLEKFTNKVTDALMMLAAAWSGTNAGKQFLAELPSIFHNFPVLPYRIKIVCVLKSIEPHQKVELSALKTKLNKRLEGRIALFDLKDVTFTDHETAIKMGLPMISIP